MLAVILTARVLGIEMGIARNPRVEASMADYIPQETPELMRILMGIK